MVGSTAVMDSKILYGYVKLHKNAKGRLFTNDYDWHSDESFWDYMERMIPDKSSIFCRWRTYDD